MSNNAAPSNQVSSQPPEQRFASQLEQLANMGFVDRQANIQGETMIIISIFVLYVCMYEFIQGAPSPVGDYFNQHITDLKFMTSN